MKQNEIKNAVGKIRLPDDAAMRIEEACRTTEAADGGRLLGARMGMRALIAVACILVLSVGVYATAHLVGFYMEKDGDTANIHATLDRESLTASEAPNRAWNANEDEVMVKLNFAYMPEDITPDLTANGKYGGAENNRSMTFSGYDLRISDFDVSMVGVCDAEGFDAGGNKAVLLTYDSEIMLYNKALYILFEDENIMLKAYVGCGITDDEIKAIAAGLSIEETDDITLALPILNEVGLGDTTEIPFVITTGNAEIFRDDLLSVGDSAHYEDLYNYDDVAVLSVEILDSIVSLDKNCFYSNGVKLLSTMADSSGNLIPYKRTQVDREAGKFGETVEVTKKLIVVTYKCTEGLKTDEGVLYPMAFLNNFILGRLVEKEDGTVGHDCTYSAAVIDSTPGTHPVTVEPIYAEQLSEDTYRYAYLIDEDLLYGELLLASEHAEIYYVIPVDELSE